MLNKKFFCKVMLGVMIAGAFNPVNTYSDSENGIVEKHMSESKSDAIGSDVNKPNNSEDVIVRTQEKVQEDNKDKEDNKPVLTEEEAIKSTEEFMKILGQELNRDDLQEIYYYGEYHNGVYEINYENEENIMFRVDAINGEVISFYSYGSDDEETLDFIEYEEAEKKALGLLKEVCSDKIENLELQEIDNNKFGFGELNFNFQRVENGIPFFDNYVNIGVDMITGEIKLFSVRWNEDLEIPVPGELKDKVEMEQKLKNNFNCDMLYSNFYKDKDLSLVYHGDYNTTDKVDAVSGEIIPNYYDFSGDKFSVSEKERKAYIEEARKNINTEILSKEEIEKKAKVLVADLVHEDAEVTQVYKSTYIDGYMEEEEWSVEFKQGDSVLGMLNLDELGELKRIYSWNTSEVKSTEDVKLTYEEVCKKALDMLVKYIPSTVEELNFEVELQTYDNLINEDYIGNEVNIEFQREINGISVPSDSISLNYSISTGKLAEVYLRFEDYNSIDSIEGIISKEEAKEKYLSNYETILGYEVYEEEESEEEKIRLVYQLQPKAGYEDVYYIGAKTGELLDFSGDKIGLEEDFKKSIEGSKYEKEIMYLYTNYYLDIEDFELNKEIALLDYLIMIYESTDYFTSYEEEIEKILFTTDISVEHESYEIIRKAVIDNIIPNEYGIIKFLEPLTREEFAKYVTYTLGHGEIGENSEYFNLSFEDIDEISEENRGYVAVVSMIGAIEGEDGKWNPKDKVTEEELIKVVYEVLIRTDI